MLTLLLAVIDSFPSFDAGKITGSSAGQMPGVCTAPKNSNSYPNKLVRSTSYKMMLLTSLSISFYCFVARESTYFDCSSITGNCFIWIQEDWREIEKISQNGYFYPEMWYWFFVLFCRCFTDAGLANRPSDALFHMAHKTSQKVEKVLKLLYDVNDGLLILILHH